MSIIKSKAHCYKVREVDLAEGGRKEMGSAWGGTGRVGFNFKSGIRTGFLKQSPEEEEGSSPAGPWGECWRRSSLGAQRSQGTVVARAEGSTGGSHEGKELVAHPVAFNSLFGEKNNMIWLM